VNSAQHGLAVVLAITLACWTVGCSQSEPVRDTLGHLPAEPLDDMPQLNAATFFAHGHLLERQGQFERAAVQYRKALRINPDFLEARNRLGITLNKLARHDEASEQFRLAISKHPDLAYLYNNLGFSLYLEGKYAEARTALETALELQEDYPRARMNYAVVLGKLDRFDEAYQQLLKACSRADACYNIGLMLTEAGRYAEAAQYLQAALDLNPDFAAARRQLVELGRLAAQAEARQALQTADARLAKATAKDAKSAKKDAKVASAAPAATSARTTSHYLDDLDEADRQAVVALLKAAGLADQITSVDELDGDALLDLLTAAHDNLAGQDEQLDTLWCLVDRYLYDDQARLAK